VSLHFYFVSKSQITQPLIVTVGRVVIEGNVSLLFNVRLDIGCCDVLLSFEEKERHVPQSSLFLSKLCRKTFHPDSSILFFCQVRYLSTIAVFLKLFDLLSLGIFINFVFSNSPLK
jgi:hypothetical protein